MTTVKVFVNNVSKTFLNTKLTKQGDRAIDELLVTFPPNVSLAINDKVTYVQDFANLDNLSAIYNFQNGTKDESGNNNHGTGTDVIYTVDDWDGYAATFNSTTSKIIIPDSNSLDLSGQFHILFWVKWTATTSPLYVFSKRSSTSNGWAVCLNKTTAGDVTFHVGSSYVTSSTAGYNDDNFHLVEIKRNSDNLITLKVDDVSKGTITNSTDLTDTNVLSIGYDTPSTSYFNGTVSRLRIYKGGLLSDVEATNIYSKRNPRSVMKFGGYITKISNELSTKDIVAHSFGKILGEFEIRGEVYYGRTPEYIVNDLITNNTSLSFNDGGFSTGLTLTEFTADGKLIDIVRDMATFTNSIFYTTGLEEFFFIPKSFTETSLHFTHGTNANISSSGFDDSEIVNELTVLGQNNRYETIDTFSGNGSTKEFTLSYNATSTKVTVGGSEMKPEEDFLIDTQGRVLNFTTAPASGTNNITAEYEYEIPLYFRGKRQSSIDLYGVRSKRLAAQWITNNRDGIRFVQSYLNRYKDITEKIRVTFGNHIYGIEENDVVQVTNAVKSIEGDFMVKSIVYTYPNVGTSLEVGEYYFGFFESDKQIVQKLHDLEGALTSVKALREWESVEDVLTLTDNVYQTVTENFTQSISMTETPVIYDLQVATWGSATYSSKGVGVTPAGKVYTSG